MPPFFANSHRQPKTCWEPESKWRVTPRGYWQPHTLPRRGAPQSRRLAAVSLIGGLCIVVGCGSPAGSPSNDEQPAPPTPPPATVGFASPDACFAALMEAAAANDLGGIVDCLTSESQQVLAAALAMAGSMSKMMSGLLADGGAVPEPMQQTLTQIDQILAKHGMSDESLVKLGSEGALSLQNPQALNDLVAPIEDKRQFVLDMMDVVGQLSAVAGGGVDLTQIGGELRDLKIDGDEATATIVKSDGTSEPATFRNTAEGWKLHLDAAQLTGPQGGGL